MRPNSNPESAAPTVVAAVLETAATFAQEWLATAKRRLGAVGAIPVESVTAQLQRLASDQPAMAAGVVAPSKNYWRLPWPSGNRSSIC